MNLPICPQHNCHPDECFEIHNPGSKRGTPVDYEKIQREIIQDRIRRQNENIRREREKMERNVVDARRRFEESKRRRGA